MVKIDSTVLKRETIPIQLVSIMALVQAPTSENHPHPTYNSKIMLLVPLMSRESISRMRVRSLFSSLNNCLLHSLALINLY